MGRGEALPKDFVWGAATSSYQVEGAAWIDGRGECIWDRFARTPGKVFQGDNGDVACDQYHLWPQDIQLMREIGIRAYRFSTAWPRIIPTGRGAVNKVGLDFYDRLTDGLLEAGIEPYVTLFHWDLPQVLQDEGGWLQRSIVDAFIPYVEAVVSRLGDRVKHWMTHNEIPCFIGQGYGTGTQAPGLQVSKKELNQGYHHACLTHGHAVRIVRSLARRDAEVGFVNNPWIPVPLLDREDHIEAARKAFVRVGANLHEPILNGRYPDWWLEKQGVDAPEIHPADMEIIGSPTDFVGINIYFGYFTEPADNENGFNVLPFPKGYPHLDLKWLKPVPQALYWAARFYREAYRVKKTYVAETGCACADEITPEGRIIDLDRMQWMRAHMLEVRRAVDEGLGLAGVFQWSLMDNFEWSEGYAKRFGMVHVDFTTQKRTLKDSACLYREMILSGGRNI